MIRICKRTATQFGICFHAGSTRSIQVGRIGSIMRSVHATAGDGGKLKLKRSVPATAVGKKKKKKGFGTNQSFLFLLFSFFSERSLEKYQAGEQQRSHKSSPILARNKKLKRNTKREVNSKVTAGGVSMERVKKNKKTQTYGKHRVVG